MTVSNKKWILTLTLLSCLILGGTVGYLNQSKNEQPTLVSQDSINVVGGILEYTKMANTIVIGTVIKTTDLSQRTGKTYPRSFVDAEIQISETLKGDKNATSVLVTTLGAQDGVVWTEDAISLNIGEKVLVMLAKDAEGNNVIFAGPGGKFVIDADNNVKDENGTIMSLDVLKNQILVALQPQQ